MYLTVKEMELLPSPMSQSPSKGDELESNEAVTVDRSNTKYFVNKEMNMNKNTKEIMSRSSDKKVFSYDNVHNMNIMKGQISRINKEEVGNRSCTSLSDLSDTPFDNFQQEAYYITGYNPENNAFYEYQGIYHSDIIMDRGYQSNISNAMSSSPEHLQNKFKYDDIALHYLSKNLNNTEFVHYSTSDQLSLKDINDDITLETVSYPFEPDDYSVSQLLLRLENVEEDVFLTQKGYKREEIICDTLQGQLLKCKKCDPSMTDSGNSSWSGMKNWLKGSYSSSSSSSTTSDKSGDDKLSKDSSSGFYAIKKTDKQLFNQRITKQDNGFNICVEENIKKEAEILKYLTMDNKSTEYIIKYVDFFESDTHYYLVMEYIDGSTNFKDFVYEAHEYINDGRLSLKEYQKIIKYIFWQISAVLHWLHNDMHCCHLDLNLENVMLKNGTFIENEDGSISINGAVSAKLCDFGVSEIFKPRHDGDHRAFRCVKTGSVLGEIQYHSPRILDEEVYDARKADNWALGMMLFEAIFGRPLYTKIDKKQGSGYWAAINNKINQFIAVNNLAKYVQNGKLLILLNGLLYKNAVKRFSSIEILQTKWFKSYFKRYQEKLEKKSIHQKKKLENSKSKMKKFQFYRYN